MPKNSRIASSDATKITRPRRLGPVIVEEQQQDRHRDDRDEEPLREVAECQEARS